MKPFIYRFDDVKIEANEFRIFKNDEAVSLEPKAFAVLTYLLEHRGRLITKDELLDAVWKDSFVTPNVLTRIVGQIRRTLGDDAKISRYIETIPTRGYRFIAEVEESEPKTFDDEISKPNLSFSVSGKIDKTLAVLPFKLLNPTDENDYLSLGLADSLITKLSNIRHLTVRPTSSVLRYAAETDIGHAGRELKVENVVDGAIQKAGDFVRVSVRLMRVADEKSLWGNTYDAKMKNIFQVQDEISTRITEALKIQLSNTEQNRMARPPTENLDAYRLYMQGNYFLYQYTPEAFQNAIEFYDQAVALDENYALAYAGLANAYSFTSNFGNDAAASKAEIAALKAVALDPMLAETHATLAATFYWLKRDEAKAQESFYRALELNPNSADTHHFYGWFLTATGRFEAAAKHLRRALELNPLSPAINVDQGLPFFFTRRYAEARTAYEKALKFDPDNWYGHLRLGEACEGLNDLNCAVSEFELAVKFSNNDPTVRAELARALALAGQKSEANKILDELTTQNSSVVSPYSIALTYAALNERNKVFETLKNASLKRDKWFGWRKVDPRFDDFRGEERFKDLLK